MVGELSAAGDSGQPLVVADPACETARQFGELGAAVVREIAKMDRKRNAVVYHPEFHAVSVRLVTLQGEERSEGGGVWVVVAVACVGWMPRCDGRVRSL